jgi:hypothetical protein
LFSILRCGGAGALEQFFTGGKFKGVKKFFHITLYDQVKLVEGKVDPVIGKPVLGEIVGTYPFRAVAGTDLAFPGLGPFGSRFGFFHFIDTGPEYTHSLGLVFYLAFFILAVDYYP